MIKIEMDSIIYKLQKFGGASLYWSNLVKGLDCDPSFDVFERKKGTMIRSMPIFSSSDIFHSSHFRCCVSSKVKKVSTVHDLTYELDLLGHGLPAKLNILERKSSYYNSDALVCVSNNTKKDLLKVYPDLNSRCKIEVIHHGFISSLGGDNKLPLTLNLSNPFYLFIGRREGYKNFKVVTESFYESLVWKDGYKLVCTGTYFTQKEIAMIKGFGLDKHVISVGNLSGISLQSLYSNAIALLYVSKYEGFGLPLLEAMKFGCPIITSNCSCMPEVVDDAAILVDPYNVGDISNAIISILDTKIQVRYKSLGYERVKKFSWESSIMKYKELYKEILS